MKHNKFIEPVPYDVEIIAKLTSKLARIVYNKLGPGLKEKTYEKCLALELMKKGLSVKRQISFPLIYDGEYLDDNYRVDIIVEDKLIVEVKVVERLSSMHKSQVLRYLKVSGKRLGLLINFYGEIKNDWIIRVVW